jgi:hypothetical protein
MQNHDNCVSFQEIIKAKLSVPKTNIGVAIASAAAGAAAPPYRPPDAATLKAQKDAAEAEAKIAADAEQKIRKDLHAQEEILALANRKELFDLAIGVLGGDESARKRMNALVGQGVHGLDQMDVEELRKFLLREAEIEGAKKLKAAKIAAEVAAQAAEKARLRAEKAARLEAERKDEQEYEAAASKRHLKTPEEHIVDVTKAIDEEFTELLQSMLPGLGVPSDVIERIIKNGSRNFLKD